MSNAPNEDLFESTKMTFGEHLEELRICLVRALLGLAIGFLIGLTIASWVVKEIEAPLKVALEEFHLEKTKEELKAQYGKVPSAVEQFMRDKGLVYEDIYWELNELARLRELMENDEMSPENQVPEKQAEQPTDLENGPGGLVIIGKPGPPSTRVTRVRIWKAIDADVTSLSAHEPFMIWIKAAVITGGVIASPWIFYQIWAFVAAGLYPHEKHYIYIFLPFSLGLFLGGAALAFFFVFEPVLEFLFKFNRMMNIDPDPRISEWMSFVLLLPIGFGISFQLPLVMLLLERIGIFTVEAYIEKWRIAVLIIFIASMLLTPADPVSMLLMAIPLTLLYCGGILLCKYMPKRKSPYGLGYDPQ